MTSSFYVGDLVWATDSLSDKRRRPALIISIKDGRYGLAHTSTKPQGFGWSTDKVSRGRTSYIAAVRGDNGRACTRWATADDLELAHTQLTSDEIDGALAEVRKQLRSAR